jgi:hypothetical protein
MHYQLAALVGVQSLHQSPDSFRVTVKQRARRTEDTHLALAVEGVKV